MLFEYMHVNPLKIGGKFDKIKGCIKVKSIHPGVSINELRNSTGFELGDLDNLKTTKLPTIDELKIIREEMLSNRSKLIQNKENRFFDVKHMN